MVLSKKAFNAVFPDGEGFPLGMKCCEDWSCFYRLAFISPLIYVGFPLGVRNNNIPGQITSMPRSERLKFMIHVINFYNLTFDFSRNYRNVAYRRFLKFDLRNHVVSMLRERDWETFNIFWLGLDSSVKKQVSGIEQFIFVKREFRLFSIAFIYLTKIIWKFERILYICLKKRCSKNSSIY